MRVLGRWEKWTRAGVIAAVVGLAALLGADARAAAQAPAETVVVDGQSPGRTFDGVGGLSAGAARLLVDYPEPERRQILDLLFSPRYGAALQVLKVDIGGDTNSTVLAEPSHMRTPDELDCGRGWEWWLMHEAKRRNPNIRLSALMWGAPGWFRGGLWTDDHVRYIVSWLDCAERQGLHIDYVGGLNESYSPPPRPAFYVALKAALRATHPDVKVVATDEHAPPDYWAIAHQMVADPALRDAIDVLGEHDVCVWRSLYQHCNVNADALALGKPLWNSEQSSQEAETGAGPLARALTRNYIDARVTGNLNWAMLAGFYGDTAVGGTGLMLAEWPWSGYYRVPASVWVDAHITQFTAPGWRYLDSASGYLASGGSYTALRMPDGDDYTVVAETLDATGPETIALRPAGGLSRGALHLWSTDLTSKDPDDWFVDAGVVDPERVTLQPGHVYTLSTTTGQRRGRARPRGSAATRLRLPYREDFEHAGADRLARYFQDAQGAFEATACTGRGGTCYRQVIDREPLRWHSSRPIPATVMGDPLWWGDYEVSADALLEQPGWVELVGRIENYDAYSLVGYHFRVSDDGHWAILTENHQGADTTLAQGDAAFGVGRWHRLGLGFSGTTVTATIDGRAVARLEDGGHAAGQIALSVSPWVHGQFDNVTIRPTKPAPRFVPHAWMTVTATSAHTGVFQHHTYGAERAIDDRPETRWTTEFDPPAALPQSITLDLGHPRRVGGLTYRPPVTSGDLARAVTGYAIETSVDGRSFAPVANGTWQPTIATKTARWRPLRARYVRLVATASPSGIAAAGEINVIEGGT